MVTQIEFPAQLHSHSERSAAGDRELSDPAQPDSHESMAQESPSWRWAGCSPLSKPIHVVPTLDCQIHESNSTLFVLGTTLWKLKDPRWRPTTGWVLTHLNSHLGKKHKKLLSCPTQRKEAEFFSIQES